MNISIFDIYNIGIGPSSSHTVGPMRASKFFVDKLIKHKLLSKIDRIEIEVYGSLASTGIGHGTDKALILGLAGYRPESINPESIEEILKNISNKNLITLNSIKQLKFNLQNDIVYKASEQLPHHPNGLLFKAFDSTGQALYNKIYYSTGGGFLVGAKAAAMDRLSRTGVELKYSFRSANELLSICKKENLNISQVVFENEKYWRSKDEIYNRLLLIWETMQSSVKNGCNRTGILPGSLKLPRRANEIYKKLKKETAEDPMAPMDWVNLYALAVNEENASGGRVVTAPTNGAAGIVPAVIHYYVNFYPNSSVDGVFRILLTAGAIALLYKLNASISGAEVGCQGEVGVACSMAAAGLTEVLGGTPEQVENSAEIAMEHNLGLTCDPIAGLVQIPCIERNAMASVKAINASRIALKGDGTHYVSLDKVIATMKRTGKDMQDKYKETSMGGLAVNITEC